MSFAPPDKEIRKEIVVLKKNIILFLLIYSLLLTLTACGGTSSVTPGTLPGIPLQSLDPGTSADSGTTAPSTPAYTNPPTISRESSTAASRETEGTTAGIETSPSSDSAPALPAEKNGYVICLDAGHQGKANTEQEPLGPGSSEMKTKVSTGTQGRTTGVPEYVVNLQVALKLQTLLEERGYEVLMIRSNHEVDISNAERAQIANEAGVDAFVRIHCNGVEDTSVHGFLAMIQTPQNPWNGDKYTEFKRLAQCIVDTACQVTGAKNMGLLETDGMTGINWCQVPTALVEMGFMTNPDEDRKLTEDTYQDLLAKGIADGLDKYFGIGR